MKKFYYLPLLCLAGMAMTGCVKVPDGGNAPGDDQLVNFDWKTTKQVAVNIVSDNGTATPVFLYNGNTLVAAGYTPFNEEVTVPVSVTNLRVTMFPEDPAISRAYTGQWIWPQGEAVDVPLASGSTIHVSGLNDLHADLFVKWKGWQQGGHNWTSFVAYWNAGSTMNSSIILYADKQPFTAADGSMDVEHSCLWPQCNHGAPIGGTSTTSGTYLFEDLFPSLGDYDMNDMVAEEYVTTTVSADNSVRSAELVYRLNAVGSGSDIAMAVSLPGVKASDIEKVEMFRIDAAGDETPHTCQNASNLFKLQNGVEISSTDEAVIPLFDNAKTLITQTTGGKFFNTAPNGGKGEPVEIKVNVSFNADSHIQASGLTDLFIMPKMGDGVDNPEKWRGREIHLADSKPTSQMDWTLFGTGNTADARSARYQTFRSKDGYVWAIYLPVTNFRHPLENDLNDAPNKIYDSYPRFQSWVESNGASDKEWYLHPNNSLVWNWN